MLLIMYLWDFVVVVTQHCFDNSWLDKLVSWYLNVSPSLFSCPDGHHLKLLLSLHLYVSFCNPQTKKPYEECTKEYSVSILCNTVFLSKISHVNMSHSPWPSGGLLFPQCLVLLSTGIITSLSSSSFHTTAKITTVSSPLKPPSKGQGLLHWILRWKSKGKTCLLFCLKCEHNPSYMEGFP